jgi:hypothetical protein
MMGGRDYSDLLYGVGVMGWFALAGIIIVYLIVLLVLYLLRKGKKSSPNNRKGCPRDLSLGGIAAVRSPLFGCASTKAVI